MLMNYYFVRRRGHEAKMREEQHHEAENETLTFGLETARWPRKLLADYEILRNSVRRIYGCALWT